MKRAKFVKVQDASTFKPGDVLKNGNGILGVYIGASLWALAKAKEEGSYFDKKNFYDVLNIFNGKTYVSSWRINDRFCEVLE